MCQQTFSKLCCGTLVLCVWLGAFSPELCASPNGKTYETTVYLFGTQVTQSPDCFIFGTNGVLETETFAAAGPGTWAETSQLWFAQIGAFPGFKTTLIGLTVGPNSELIIGIGFNFAGAKFFLLGTENPACTIP